MKYFTYIWTCLLAVIIVSSCDKDFLQQDPIQEMAEGSYLKNESDLPFYLNQFYPAYIVGHQNGTGYSATAPYGVQGSPIALGDIVSDNVIGFTGAAGNPNSRLDGSFKTPTSKGDNGWSWGNIWKLNYFLKNTQTVSGNQDNIRSYLAEARFFKAWDYYQKLVTFGEVPWIDEPLNIDSEELYAPRTERAALADSILNCLDYAVTYLKDAPAGGDPDGRINKDMANFLKARFCLFEGTFRKYHVSDNFHYVSGEQISIPTNYQKFLDACITACEAIINTGHYKLFTSEDKTLNGKETNSYWKLFSLHQNPDLDKNTEAILARVYDGANLGSGFLRYYAMNRSNASGRYSKGMTRGAEEEYLCINGTTVPENRSAASDAANGGFKGYDGEWTELENRDPRLKQTVVYPGEGISVWGRDAKGVAQAKRWPQINYSCPSANQVAQSGPCITGYEIQKWWTPDVDDYTYDANKGTVTGLMFRYAEVLLMYAEALYERNNTITNEQLDLTINALRIRAGYDFVKYPKSKLSNETVNLISDPRLDNIYAEKLDYTVSPMLREIRRERRVELMMEGMRREDLIRWKAGRLMEVPLRGMKVTAAKEASYASGTLTQAIPATKGTDYFLDGDGFIIGFPKASNVSNGTLVWEDKYYYFPIPLADLELNPALFQSPGWEDITR